MQIFWIRGDPKCLLKTEERTPLIIGKEFFYPFHTQKKRTQLAVFNL